MNKWFLLLINLSSFLSVPLSNSNLFVTLFQWCSKASKKQLQQWDSLTAKFAGAANVPFLLLQLPQIVLNARNLLAGNNSALFAVPWLVSIPVISSSFHLLSFPFLHRWISNGGRECLLDFLETFRCYLTLQRKGKRRWWWFRLWELYQHMQSSLNSPWLDPCLYHSSLLLLV